MPRILVVEDDYELNHTICYALQQNHYETKSAYSIAEAKECCQSSFAIVLLDVNLPDGEGFLLCEWMKRKGRTPVLFLTARDLEEDALKGYDAGADDYIVKPFSIKILLKKMAVILSRQTENDSQRMIFDDGYLYIDLENARVRIEQQECAVTPTELRLLKQFIMHKGQLLTYDVLLERLWDSGGKFVDKHALAVNVNRLRGKIEDEHHSYITNIYGMGYQWIGTSFV